MRPASTVLRTWANSEMSAPALKLPPVPVRTTTRTSARRPTLLKISPSRCHMASVSALRFCARLSVTVAMPAASTSVRISSSMSCISPTSLLGSVLRALVLPVPVLRQFGQFNHQVTGCFWVQKDDPAITMPDHRLLLLEADTLGAKLDHCRVDILDLKADVEEPISVLGDPPARSGVGFVGFK